MFLSPICKKITTRKTPSRKDDAAVWIVEKNMEKNHTVMQAWLARKSKQSRSQLLASMGRQMQYEPSMPIEGVLEQLAAGLMGACAEDLGLSVLELSGLLRTPRKDALAGLITVLRDQH